MGMGSMKNIIFCSDGTGNTPKDNTNVYRIFQMLQENDSQIKVYDKGVGTKLSNVLHGSAFGCGLFNNVLDGFRFLSDNFEEEDRIYLFGFSRGAYTVRSLASMVSLCGLAPSGSSRKTVSKFWGTYKVNRKSEKFRRNLAGLRELYGSRKATIEAVCVWDTVGSIGKQTRTNDIRKKLSHRFHRMSVFREVNRIYHAVSIDERRTQFYPHLLNDQAESTDTAVEEVWFPGVHSDIGGSFRDDDSSLGDITLDWMLSRVRGELQLKDEFVKRLKPDPLGKMHNIEGGLIFSFFRKKNRAIRRGSVLHHSVITRISEPPHEYHQHREPTGNYSPLALSYANYAKHPDFGMDKNYRILSEFSDEKQNVKKYTGN